MRVVKRTELIPTTLDDSLKRLREGIVTMSNDSRFPAFGLDRHKVAVVLGSAPDPTPIPFQPDQHQLLCVNAAGSSAVALGLPRPTITFLTPHKLFIDEVAECKNALSGLECRHTVLMRGKNEPELEELKAMLFEIDYRSEEVSVIAKADRLPVVQEVTGIQEWSGNRYDGKVSNGIFVTCFALYHGVPEVILSGISLTKQGHNYGDSVRYRNHSKADEIALEGIAALGHPVATTEPELAEQFGFRLIPSV